MADLTFLHIEKKQSLLSAIFINRMTCIIVRSENKYLIKLVNRFSIYFNNCSKSIKKKA